MFKPIRSDIGICKLQRGNKVLLSNYESNEMAKLKTTYCYKVVLFIILHSFVK